MAGCRSRGCAELSWISYDEQGPGPKNLSQPMDRGTVILGIEPPKVSVQTPSHTEGRGKPHWPGGLMMQLEPSHILSTQATEPAMPFKAPTFHWTIQSTQVIHSDG